MVSCSPMMMSSVKFLPKPESADVLHRQIRENFSHTSKHDMSMMRTEGNCCCGNSFSRLETDKCVHVCVCRPKMEVATKEVSNPIKQDMKKGKLRDYPLDIFWNYGMFPADECFSYDTRTSTVFLTPQKERQLHEQAFH